MDMYDKLSAAEPKQATSIEVARLANVSQSTVSRAFSNRDNVNPDTYERVMAAAAQLNYTPNALASGLASRKSNIIAIVTIDFITPHRAAIINKLSQRFRQEGKQILYFETTAARRLEDVLAEITRYQVEGVVITSASVIAQEEESQWVPGVPVVIFNKQAHIPGVHVVCSDNVEAGRMVALHFIEKGYQSFGYLGSPKLRLASSLRRQGFVERLREFGIEKCLCLDGECTYEFGREAVRQMVVSGTLPRALFCADDLTALGVLDELREGFHLRVPEQVAVCGFDDIEMAAWGSYQLTTVHQPLDEMVEEACQTILEHIQDKTVSQALRVFKCHLVKRTTV